MILQCYYYFTEVAGEVAKSGKENDIDKSTRDQTGFLTSGESNFPLRSLSEKQKYNLH